MSQAHAGAGATVSLDTDQRVKFAEDMLTRQYTGRQIVKAICDQFGVVERTAYSYIAVAYERLQPVDDQERAMRKTLARGTWQAQYRRALAAGDFGAANYAFDRLCKLDGVYAPQKHKIEVSPGLGYAPLSIRAVMNVLDSAGLDALDIVLAQLEAAKARGALVEPEPVAALPAGVDATDVIDLDDPQPAPVVKPRGGRVKRKKT